MNLLKSNQQISRKIIFLGFFLFMVTALFAEAPKNQPSELPPLTGNIKICGRQLLINGTPFIMKGICYSPVRKGEKFPEGLRTLHPSNEDLAVVENDFKMMKEAGINTIRLYVPITDERVLNLLTKYQLRTIVPICQSWKMKIFDFASTIDLLKNHPSTLMWEVGNEWNYNLFYSDKEDKEHPAVGPIDFKECSKNIKNIAKYIRAQDSKHPISTIVGEIPKGKEGEFRKLFKGVDLAGMNVYDWLSFRDRFEKWKKLTDKPMYLGEYGANAYNQKIKAEDGKSQAYAERILIKEIFNNLSALNPNNVLVGACLFEWCDEWWKDEKGTPWTHDIGGIDAAERCGPYPDKFFTEEWWGIVDIDRNKRPAYYTIKELFTMDPMKVQQVRVTEK